jgi:Tfp pilus assembly protein PilN
MNEDKSDQYEGLSLADLATTLRDMKHDLDRAAKEKTEIQKEYDFLSMTILPDRMEEERVSTMKIPGVGRLQAKADIRISVLAQNRDALQTWLKEMGHASMVAPTVNASTLKAFIKEQMKEEHGVWPQSLVKVDPFTKASVVKA